MYLVWICYWDEESAARAERVGRGEKGQQHADKQERGSSSRQQCSGEHARRDAGPARSSAGPAKGRDRAWGRGRLGVLGLRVEIGRVN